MQTSKFEELAQFIDMGWSLIPLHDVSAGKCSCSAGEDCPEGSRGKHPRSKSWQKSGWYRDRDQLAAIVIDRPEWNWGAVTGTASGQWTLDVDTDNGGLASLGDLLAEAGLKLDLPHALCVGALITRIHRTGSGGLHLIFAIGADGWMPERNSVSRLGRGLDVRTEGGQIVLPPSVSGKGAYSVVLDRAPAECPPTLRAEIERRLAPPPRDPVLLAPALDARQDEVSPGGDRYAARVVAEELEACTAAEVGTRNTRCYQGAVRLWELILAPWCTLAEDDVQERFWEAAGATGAPDVELQGLWQRGYARALEKRDAGEGAVLPAIAGGVAHAVPFGSGSPVEGGTSRTPDSVALELQGITDAEKLFARTRELALQVIQETSDPAERQLWRTVLKEHGGLSFGDFGQLAAWYSREQKRLARLAASVELRREARELPEPDDPTAVVENLVTEIPSTGGVPHWAWWRGDWYRWTGAHWESWPEAELERWLYRQTEAAFYEVPDALGGTTAIRWKPDKSKIEKLRHALAVNTLQRLGEPDTGEIACANVVVDPVTGLIRPHSPDRFNLASLPFDYMPAAGAPAWSAFLDEVFVGQPDARDLLQEWFGYVVSGRSDQQKIMSLVGPRRCGKGTIARVLTALLGPTSVCAPTLGRLATEFGLEPLIGRSLAVMGDVRWNARDAAEAVPFLLGISGEDSTTVNRKNRPQWTGRLGTRFMLMSNDAPSFLDPSGALASRFLHIELTQSWYGREDLDLPDRLLTELPGILNWALAGLARLSRAGRFTESAAGARMAREVTAFSSPIQAFVEERCTVGYKLSTGLVEAYEVYRRWALGEGMQPKALPYFSRDLVSAYRGRVAVARRRGDDGERQRVIEGMSLALPASLPDDAENARVIPLFHSAG